MMGTAQVLDKLVQCKQLRKSNFSTEEKYPFFTGHYFSIHTLNYPSPLETHNPPLPVPLFCQFWFNSISEEILHNPSTAKPLQM